jgi:hypothetical protein
MMFEKFTDPYALQGRLDQLRSENPKGTFDLQGTGPMWEEDGEQEFLENYRKSPFAYKQPEGYDEAAVASDVMARSLELTDPNDPDSARKHFIPGYTRGQYDVQPSASGTTSGTTSSTTPSISPEQQDGTNTVLKNDASDRAEAVQAAHQAQIKRQEQIQAKAEADGQAGAQGYDWSSLLKPGLMGAGIGGAAGAGIHMWRRSQVIDDLIEQGYTEEEAEEMAPSILSGAGYGALAGAGIGAGYQHLTA